MDHISCHTADFAVARRPRVIDRSWKAENIDEVSNNPRRARQLDAIALAVIACFSQL